MNNLNTSSFQRLACVMSLVPLMVFSQDKMETEPPALVKLKEDYDKARGAAMGALNKAYIAQSELLVKSFMTASDLNNANRASAFVQQLSDADEENDTEGITATSATGDRLGTLQSRYIRDREEAVRRVKGSFAGQARTLQQQYMRANDLAGANGTAKFLQGVTAEAAQAAGSTAPGRGVALLSAANARKWKQGRGEWKIEPGKLTGSGDSEIVYADGASPPFTLQFKIKVLDGMRPRVIFGPIKFANEGFEKTFGLYPGGDDPKRFSYQHKMEYKVAIVVTKKKTDLFVDEQLVTTGPGVKDKVAKFAFCGGDSWSKGAAEYRDIVLLR